MAQNGNGENFTVESQANFFVVKNGLADICLLMQGLDRRALLILSLGSSADNTHLAGFGLTPFFY